MRIAGSVEIIPWAAARERLPGALLAHTPLARLKRGDRVAIKPNLTAPKPTLGVTTTREVVEELVRYCADCGARIAIVESDGGNKSFSIRRAFELHGLNSLARYGAELVDLTAEPSRAIQMDTTLGQVAVPWPCRLIEDTEYFCSVPVPKVHCMTGISLAAKNQWGCVPDVMRLRFHPFFNEVIWPLNELLPNAFAVLDARYGLTRQGPIDGDPVEIGFVAVASSVGVCDAFGADFMGVNIDSVPHLKVGRERGRVPLVTDVRVEGPIEDYRDPNRFILKRNFWNYVALPAFKSPKLNHLVYLSGAAGILHKVMYSVRKRPPALSE